MTDSTPSASGNIIELAGLDAFPPFRLTLERINRAGGSGGNFVWDLTAVPDIIRAMKRLDWPYAHAYSVRAWHEQRQEHKLLRYHRQEQAARG